MSRVIIYSNNTVTIDGKHIGGIKAVSKSGNEQRPSSAQRNMTTRIYSLNHDPVDIDLPIYADGKVNQNIAEVYLANKR